MMVRVFCVLMLVGLTACGEAANDLWGSIDESFPLNFDRVDILKQNLALRIEYIKKIHGGEDKVCKVVVNTNNLNIKDNSELKGDAFADEIVTVERVAATGGDYPPITGGNLRFDVYEFKTGGKIDGDFTVNFQNGRNLFGNFDGKVKEISVE